MTEHRKELAITHRNPIVVSVSLYRGEPRVDIRHHYHKDGAVLPTKKGINLPLHEIDMLIEALQEAKAAQA